MCARTKNLKSIFALLMQKNTQNYVKGKTNQHQTNVYVFVLLWILHCCFKKFQMFLIKNKQMCSQKVVLFLFKRQRLLSRFKTAFNIAILQTQYASY